MRLDCDIAIVGSGFGGSLLAMVASRLGYRVALLERGRHPRFAIGESASPLAGILLEQLADRYDLPRIRPLSAFGPWQRAYPEIGCGLKRGFTYFRHGTGQRYRVAADRSNQLLVAASPNDEVSDTHWLRADVDHFLARDAVATGVEYLDELHLDKFDQGSAACTLTGTRRAATVRVRAQFVVDASGPNGFLSRALGLRNLGFAGYPATQALFSHFTAVAKCADMPEYAACSRLSGEMPPYPMDDAALHHVFDGGWMWVLRFGNGVTSAGIAVTEDLARDLRLADGAPAWRRLLSRYPSIAAQFADAEPIREFTWMPRVSWRGERAAGPQWAMLPSSAAFVDPLFSTGIPLTLLGIERLARILEGEAARAGTPGERDLADYAAITLDEADRTARFVGGCYTAFPQFGRFAAYSMFYFAAASYAEMARRLGVHAEARFLGGDRPGFADALVRLSPRYRAYDGTYDRDVARAIDPLNVAGLCDPSKRNWYPVDAADTVRAAAKLGLSAPEVAERLRMESGASAVESSNATHASTPTRSTL